LVARSAAGDGHILPAPEAGSRELESGTGSKAASLECFFAEGHNLIDPKTWNRKRLIRKSGNHEWKDFQELQRMLGAIRLGVKMGFYAPVFAQIFLTPFHTGGGGEPAGLYASLALFRLRFHGLSS
jgi:hypothetical protein